MTVSPLSAADLAQMRAAALELMPDLCSILRPTQAPDGQGGYSETFATVATSVHCRLAAAGYQSQERLIAERSGADMAWQITLPQGTDIRTTDQIAIGARVFEVVGVTSGRAWEMSIPVAAREVS